MKKIIKIYIILSSVFFAVPIFAAPALQFPTNGTLIDVVQYLTSLMNLLIPLIIGAAFVVFMYGILRFIARSSAGDAEGRKEGINFMVFGILGIAVMFSIWGLVAFLTNTLGTSSAVPQFPSQLNNPASMNNNPPAP